MKRNVVIFAILFLFSGGVFSQNKDLVTEAWAAEQLGQRFISAKDAGFDNLEIPFARKDLLFDRKCFLAPIVDLNQITKYILVQARVLPNLYEKNDTLSLVEAEQLVSLMAKSNRNFPNNQELKLFKTRDRFFKQGREYTKTIVSDGINYYVIDLPSNISVVVVDSNFISFIADENDKISISISQTKNNGCESIKYASVMTLVNLIPDQ